MVRASRSEVWGTVVVNCWQKAEAIWKLSVRVRLLKVMGWLGGRGWFLPVRVSIIRQNLVVLSL